MSTTITSSYRPFHLLGSKNNNYLVIISKEGQDLNITLENEKSMQKEIYEYNSAKIKLPGIFNYYSVNEIIIKLNEEKNKLSILEENNKIKLIYTGVVKSEKAIFDMNKKEKTLEEKINELYNIVKYQKDKIDNIYGFQSIILSENEKETVLKWLKEDANIILNLKLVYRRGNNMDLSYFHKKCDNIGPNLVICESINNEIFGGYSPFSYEGSREVHDKKAFIFSLTKNKKYQNRSQSKSSWINTNHGPDFHWDFTFNYGTMKVCRSCILKDKDKHNIETGESLLFK